MSFLTPLYIAGLAAIALPLVFHLIRRTPRGQTPFSSLMFLTPSPPRITRRSRLDQLLLLLLRALALTLLALAFARPFFREAAQLGLESSQGQRVAILVDASASMKREDLWRQAQERVAQIVRELKPTDQAALFVFDDEVTTLADFDDPAEIDPRRRAALFRQRLAETAPTWAAGDLGNALAAVADRLDALDRGRESESDVARCIILVSDMQQGARIDALQAYEWPTGVELEAEPLLVKNPANAGLHLIGQAWLAAEEAAKADAPAAAEESRAPLAGRSHRVRVVNAADSTAEQFKLAWLAQDDRTLGRPTKVYVPPGQSRIVSVQPPDPTRPLRLVLRGDAHDFDNTLHLAPQERKAITVAYLGDDAADDPQGCRYYLERALPDTPQRVFHITTPASQEPLAPPGDPPPRLVVVAGSLSDERAQELRRYIERGGRTLLVLLDGQAAAPVASLLDQPLAKVEESQAGDYALLGTIDFTHPLFAPLADPRYNDFTKIHFWRHRRLTVDEADEAASPSELSVLARFDTGDPALVERRVRQGRLWVLATSWRPADSQLARSSKFVPLLLGMIGAAAADEAAITYVGQPLRLPASALADPNAPAIRRPDGTQAVLSPGAEEFRETDEPGVYVLGDHRLAVHLDPAESDTAPRPVEELEQFGVRLTGAERRAAEEQRQRHLRDVELENHQKIWRWLLAAALGLLVIETWYAGRQSRPRPNGGPSRSE